MNVTSTFIGIEKEKRSSSRIIGIDKYTTVRLAQQEAKCLHKFVSSLNCRMNIKIK
jgi:hypothetical protein